MLLVVAPMEREYASLVAAIDDLAPAALGRLEGARSAAGDLVLVRGGLGKAQFAVHTLHALQALAERGEPADLVICAGTSGALDETLAVADVVVGTHTVEHDFHAGAPSPEFAGDEPTLDALRADEELRTLDFTLHFGRIASGDEGILDRRRAGALHRATGALVVAWEGAGGARAAGFAETPFLELRAVSDHAGPDAIEHYRANTPRAMANVAMILGRLRRGAG